MTSTLITAAIILGALFIFIIFFIVLNKKGHNKKLARQNTIFADLVWKNKLEISEKEAINDHIIAIDKLNFVLVYINFNEAKEEISLIDLWRVKSIKVVIEDNSVYEQKKGKTVLIDKQVSRLQLEIILGDNQSKANLLLFQYKDGMHDFVQIKSRASYWCEMINNCIKELPHTITYRAENA